MFKIILVITLKTKKIFNFTIELFLVCFLIVCISASVYVIGIAVKSETPKVATIINSSSSIILDNEGTNVTTLNLVNNNSVTFEDLPDVFINALISAEDARFFAHSGVDFQRILSAMLSNVTTGSTQGASTLTQQLIKNIFFFIISLPFKYF